MITRRELLRGTGALGIAGLGSSLTRCSIFEEVRDSRPNILLIMTDQQTSRAMSVAGNPHLRTPAMDHLAGSGIRFEHSYCTSPICGPARSSIITGRMPHETRVNWNVDTPDPAIPNLGEIFREVGYRTVWAGKWHLPRMYPHKFKDGFVVQEYLPESMKKKYYKPTDAGQEKEIKRYLDKLQKLVEEFNNGDRVKDI